MARALLVAALGAPLLAWSWMSLESGHDAGQATLVVVLAIAAALVRPRWARVAACLAALLVAGAIAFGVGHVWALPGADALPVRERLPRVLRLPGAVRPGDASADARRPPARVVRLHARLCAGGRRPQAGPGCDGPRRRRRLAGDAAARPRPPARDDVAGGGARHGGAAQARPRARPRRRARSGHADRSGGTRRDELARIRQARLPELAALGPVHEARQAGRRLLRVELGLRRPHLPRQADDRHAREGRAAGALLARVGAEHGPERDLVRGGLAGARQPAGAARPARPRSAPGATRRWLGEGARDDRSASRQTPPGRERPRAVRTRCQRRQRLVRPDGDCARRPPAVARGRLRRLELRAEPDAAPARCLEADLFRRDRRAARRVPRGGASRLPEAVRPAWIVPPTCIT